MHKKITEATWLQRVHWMALVYSALHCSYTTVLVTLSVTLSFLGCFYFELNMVIKGYIITIASVDAWENKWNYFVKCNFNVYILVLEFQF